MIKAFVALALASFVVGSAQAFTIKLDFDDQKAGQDCEGIGSGRSYISTEVPASPPNVCTFWIEKGETGWGTWGGTIDLPHKIYEGGEIWIRWRVYMPKEFDYSAPNGSHRLKFMRVRTYDGNGKYVGYDNILFNKPGSAHPFGFIYSGVNEWEMFGQSNDAPQLGSWETYELYLRLDDSKDKGSAGAVVRFWKNGGLILETFDRKTLKSAGGYANYIYLTTYWNGGSPKDQHMYVDDIVVTTETPINSDRNGNAFVGVGDFSPPNAPRLLGAQ